MHIACVGGGTPSITLALPLAICPYYIMPTSQIYMTLLHNVDSPTLHDVTATSTTIGLSWTQIATVDSYTVSYTYTIRRCGSGSVSGSVEISNGNARSFTLADLEDDSDYTITLIAHDISAGGYLRIPSNQISTTTDISGIETQ